MDNPWQNKCSSTWQSSTTSSMASSSQLPSQESRSQLEMNTGHYFYPHVPQDPRSTARGRVREPMFLNPLNSGSYKSDHAELGNSFLAILSGPPSLLQCDFQQLSNPKPCNTSTKLPINSSGVMINAAGSGVLLTPTGPLSENLGNQNPRNGADLRPVVSSRAVVGTNCSSTSVLHNDLQAANFNLQSSDLAKAVSHHIFPGNEKVSDFCSPRGGWHTGMNPANSGKLHSTNSQASQKMPSGRNASTSSQSSTFLSGCPRVFCLGTSGDLLLSNTGLLGVVCSCHCLHMSISKFCEHSGLFDVNPGDAVRMDSGETIAQWHKIYFQKFGIRVPEDQSGWDWPEWFSATAGLVKSSSSMLNMSTNSDLSHLVGSSGGLVKPGQPWDNSLFPKNPVTTQNPVNDVLHNKQQRNGQDSCNFLLKGLTGASQSNLHAVADNQMIECPMSRCSTMSKLVSRGGPDNGSQSISTYIDSISKSGNSFISHPTLHNLRTPGKDSDVRKSNNSKEGVIVDRDAVSSNIELRLGQPNQQSQNFGNSFLSVIGPQLLDTLGDPEKSLSLEQLIHNKDNFRVTEKCRQYPQCAAGTSNSSARREQSQLNVLNYAFGINNAIDAAKLEQCKGDAAKSSVISMLLSRVNTPSEGNVHSKAINNMANGSEHFMPRTQHCESPIAKSHPLNFPWNGGDGLERHLNIKESGFHRHMDKGKRVGFVVGDSYVATESDYGFHKRMDNSISFNGVVGGSNNPSSSAVHDKSFYSRQMSGMPPVASDAINFFNHSGKVPCFGSSGHFDNVFLRTLSSPLGSGLISPPQAVSMGFSSATSTSIPNMTPALSNREGIGVSPYLVDENLRLLAVRQMLELSKRGHAVASLGMNHEHGRISSSSDVKIQGVDPSTSEERKHGANLTRKQDASEVAMKSLHSGAMHRMGGDIDKLAHMAGLNNWCNFPTSTQGISLHSKEIDMQCQFSHDSLPNEQPSLRLGRTESNITPSIEHGKVCQRVPYTYFPGNCSCDVRTKCFGGDCDSKCETSLNAFKEQIGSVGCKASMLFASKFDKDHTGQKEKSLSLEQSGKTNGHTHKKIDCHAFQWKDVPSKVMGVCNVTCLDQPHDGLDGRGNDEDQLADTAAKCFNGTAQEANTLKEREMSNISSGCSTPAVTQASIEVNNMDSCTIDAGGTRYANDLVVDEGSGIDKCWSSDDALDSERSAEFLGSTCKSNSIKERSSKALANRSSRSLIDELKLMDSYRRKKVRNQIHTGLTVHDKTNHPQTFPRGSKTGKRARAIKWKLLDASFPASGLSSVNYESPICIGSAEWHSRSSNDRQMLLLSDQGTSHPCGACSVEPNFKRRSLFSSAKTLSRKRDLHRLYNHREEKDDYETDHTDFVKIPDVSCGKRLRQDRPADAFKQVMMQEPNRGDSQTTAKFNSIGSIKASSSRKMNICNRKARPVVCGKYGIISNGKLAVDVSKPAKIVSLSTILKTARRCTLSEKGEARLTSMRELKKTSFRGSDECFDGISNLKKEKVSENHNVTVCNEVDPDTSMELTEKACFSGDKEHADELSMLEKERDVGSVKIRSILDSYRSAGLKPKSEIRKRSLCELIVKGKKSSSSNFSLMKISKCGLPQKNCRSVGMFLKSADDSERHSGELCNVNAKKSIKEHRCESFISDLDAFCCVCGSSNKDEVNCLVECSRCLIRVHQACYGVAKVPKGRWYCRPCRTSSKDIACVLCGNGGGAMTRALRSRNIVKTLLQAWTIETEYKPKNKIPPAAFKDKLSILNSSRSELEGDLFPVIRPVNIEPSSTVVWEMDLQNQSEVVKNSPGSPRNLKVHNSITAGVLDSTVKQWVHMVCGLWTPGTRCPNVDTMSAFDVSGAARSRVNVGCSICGRLGGSCIQCRVVNCSVQFHPWCAHQKGLLQSEVEGVDNESVGFYGRCVLHATYPPCESDGEPIDTVTGCPGEKELTCARSEGYKGRKRDGFRHNPYCQSNGNSGCLVPQEQLNAWLHINGQKSCTKGLPKQPISDIEYDCRKEYARYKQAKGWKHLVVYKSGIHALGLYTSRFISRGAMVVEYVGEIVGLRVADKRESEYQSGRKLQYKSACYFFRIDKEHIIDATRKGGIARFVNHSCLPNCVAKVISVRNEKKVVFFAERDIYPGEEITYDYHFNHEDEGKKIPCFCNSKNCRRSLN